MSGGSANGVEWRELTPEQWAAVDRSSDYRTIFTEQEVAEALRFVMSRRQAASTARAIYHRPLDAPGVIFFHGDLFNALSLVSADAAERVRRILKETEEEAAQRVAAFRASLGLYRDC